MKHREVKWLETYQPDHVEMQHHAREFKLHLVQCGKAMRNLKQESDVIQSAIQKDESDNTVKTSPLSRTTLAIKRWIRTLFHYSRLEMMKALGMRRRGKF